MKKSSLVALLCMSTIFSITYDVKMAEACAWWNPLCSSKPNSGTSTIEPAGRPQIQNQERLKREAREAKERSEREVREANERLERQQAEEEKQKRIEDAARIENAQRMKKRDQLDRAKLIVETLRGRSDVRNISLKKDPDDNVIEVCYKERDVEIRRYHDNANHPNAYVDGYREGKMSAQKGEKYSPRTGGGEFGRGFDDGYNRKESTGQDANATVHDSEKKVYVWNDKCDDV